MEKIDASGGAVLYAAGVFYYFKTEDVKILFQRIADRFPGSVIVFDSCNRRGAKMMMKTWLKEAGITDVRALFSLENPEELKAWSPDFASVTSKSDMRGYRDIYKEVGFVHRLLIRMCDGFVNMRIVKVRIREK